MGLERTTFWYCDHFMAQGIDRAAEATGDMDDDAGPIELPPPGWYRVDIRTVRENPAYEQEVEEIRKALREVVTLGESDVDPEEIEKAVQAQLHVQPELASRHEVVLQEGALSPEKGRWLALVGFTSCGADPTAVWRHVADRLGSVLTWPDAESIAEVFADAFFPGAEGSSTEGSGAKLDDLDPVMRQRVVTAIGAVIQALQATVRVNEKDIRAAVNIALDLSPESPEVS